MKFSTELKKYREARDYTKKKLADLIGVKSQYLIAIEKGNAMPPTPERCEQIANALRLSEQEKRQFIELAIIERAKDETVQLLTTEKKIPVISWVQANRFGDISDPFPPGISDEWVKTTVKGDNIFALRVRDDCMEPIFKDGDIITIKPGIEVKHGDYVIIADRLTEKATFKQLIIKGKRTFLHPLNHKYSDIELDHDERYEIVGKVVERTTRF